MNFMTNGMASNNTTYAIIYEVMKTTYGTQYDSRRVHICSKIDVTIASTNLTEAKAKLIVAKKILANYN